MLATREGDAEKIEDVEVAGVTLRRLTQKGESQLDWGFQGEYFLLTVGKQTSADLLARLDKAGSPPGWLDGTEKAGRIKRIGTVSYINASRTLGGNRAADSRSKSP